MVLSYFKNNQLLTSEQHHMLKVRAIQDIISDKSDDGIIAAAVELLIVVRGRILKKRSMISHMIFLRMTILMNVWILLRNCCISYLEHLLSRPYYILNTYQLV